MINKNEIWLQKQNKPTLIVDDIIKKYPNVDKDFIYEVLLRRGVFKWLSVRRDLIKYKNILKDKIRELNRRKNNKEKGYLKALEECRKNIRAMCHSDRWVAPDFDKKANLYLKSIKE